MTASLPLPPAPVNPPTFPRTRRRHGVAALALLQFLLAAVRPPAAQAAAPEPDELAPGMPYNYERIAFQPDVWRERKQDFNLLPWIGRRVTFLTTPGDYDHRLMRRWVQQLDRGWTVCEGITGARPREYRLVAGRPVITAVPDPAFTCGAGCGFVGATGIELALFYSHDYAALKADTNAMPHYVFYEMGRNFFTFGDRHSCFTTGFAVFLRYVVMDILQCTDRDAATRRVIESVEPALRTNTLPFLKLFTAVDGLDEKAPRVRDAAGQWLTPSDQPVVYASAMLRLRRECGGDAWVKGFCAALRDVYEAAPDSPAEALRQGWFWYVAASVAARRDLAPVFADDWHLPLSDATRKELAALDWKSGTITVHQVLDRVKPTWRQP